MSDDLGSTPQDPDSEGCLCVVASHANAAPLVDSVTRDTAARLMMSPALGDFVELRFAGMGPQPEQAAELNAAVQRVTDQLLCPRRSVGRNYFALVVVDQSAATVEQVLGDCAASPLLAALPIRFHGIASYDDRRRNDRTAVADIVVPPDGSWTRGSLVDELRRYCDELLRHFAAGQEDGLARDQVGVLRTKYKEHAMNEHGPERPAPAVLPPPDVLALQSQLPLPDQSQAAGPDGAEQAGKPDQPGLEPDTPYLIQRGAAQPAPPLSRPGPRWHQAMRWRRGQDAGREPTIEPGRPGTRGLVYLLVTGETIMDDRAAWNRSRSALLEVDAKIAAVPGVAYQVRALQGDEEALRGELREAGQLTRRDVKRPVIDADFARVLEEMGAMLKRDRALIEAGGAPAAHPAVVFFTLDPPLADTVTAEVFRDLAEEASIVWVVPKGSADLVASAFTQSPGTTVVIDHETVAEELAVLLGSTSAAHAGAEPRLREVGHDWRAANRGGRSLIRRSRPARSRLSRRAARRRR
jgi:hypothetical protein